MGVLYGGGSMERKVHPVYGGVRTMTWRPSLTRRVSPTHHDGHLTSFKHAEHARLSIMMDWQLLAQAWQLLFFAATTLLVAAWKLPWYLLQNAVLEARTLLIERDKGQPEAEAGAVFFEGQVNHVRRQPKTHSFKYKVRTAFISLDHPPTWFTQQAKDHMSADEARSYAGTDGDVWLLTNPMSAGYVMNPISVYYCYSIQGELSKCIAEVTNTPWNERVTFVFLPHSNHDIKKALHVSPLMDMAGTWQLEAVDPTASRTLKLVVRVKHPQHGNFFHADLVATRCEGRWASSRNEEAGLWVLLKYGLQNHRIAFWIYWQAVVLLWRGLPMYSPPSRSVLDAAAAGAQHPTNQVSMCPFTWRPAPGGWPWDTWAGWQPPTQLATGKAQ